MAVINFGYGNHSSDRYSSRYNRLKTDTLEVFIRTALELGELSPGMAVQVDSWIRRGNLSEREQKLLKILQDAIQDGQIRRSA